MCYHRQMEKIGRRESSGQSLVIRPPEALGIGRTENNPDELERVYQMGRREGTMQLESVRSFIGA